MYITEKIDEYLNEADEDSITIKGKTFKYKKRGNVYVFDNLDLSRMILSKIPKELQNLGKYEVKGDFGLHHNILTSLKGSPEVVGGNFHCYQNELKSLEGAPKKIGKTFNCDYNNISKVIGAPKTVGGNFTLRKNTNLSKENIEWLNKNVKIKGKLEV